MTWPYWEHCTADLLQQMGCYPDVFRLYMLDRLKGKGHDLPYELVNGVVLSIKNARIPDREIIIIIIIITVLLILILI